MKYQNVLSIETSCDDTSVAIVRYDGFVYAQTSASQDLQHAPYGGVVPEIASRNHSVALLPLIEETFHKAQKNWQIKNNLHSQLSWNEIDGIAVTNRPGLIGSLIVGLMTAKALSQSLNKPYLGVNHLEGHLLAPFLHDENFPQSQLEYPYIALAVSGGHTSLYWVKDFGDYTIIGTTKDDAAGEAYDKFAKMLNLGFPGGVRVDQLAQEAEKKLIEQNLIQEKPQFEFPQSLLHEKTLMMSFSGLKSAAQRILTKMTAEEVELNKQNLCYGFQKAVTSVLIHKLRYAAQLMKTKRVVITGGVSANSQLRKEAEKLKNQGFEVVIPPLRYCTDNAAMIGYAGIQRMNRGQLSPLTMGPASSSIEGDFTIQLKEEIK